MSALDPVTAQRALETFSVVAPQPTHWKRVTCASYECDGWRHGFVVTVDPATILGRHQRDWLRAARTSEGYRFVEQLCDDGLVRFTFGPGQTCFVGRDAGPGHWVQNRPELYLVRAGGYEHRGDLIRRHTRPQDWVEHFNDDVRRHTEARAKG